MLAPDLALLRHQGIAVIGYLDNLLLQAETHFALVNYFEIMMHMLQDFRWVLNMKTAARIRKEKILAGWLHSNANFLFQ